MKANGLRENLHRMCNTDLNNLAKNPYCDEDIQVWLANHGHLQARYYLAENQNLCDSAIEVLKKGKSNVAKLSMIQYGHINDEEEIRKLYHKCKGKVSAWMIRCSFVKNEWWTYSGGRTVKKNSDTPGDVLEDIYRSFRDGSMGYSTYLASDIATHRNCTLKLSIMISQESNPRAKLAGQQALVRISKEGLARTG
jgi:hypothetical protein